MIQGNVLPALFRLESYGESARHLAENIETYGRVVAEGMYRDLIAQQEAINSYNAAWLDAFGGPEAACEATLLARQAERA